MSRLIDPPEVADTTCIHSYRTERGGEGLRLSRLGEVVKVCAPCDDGLHDAWTKTVYRTRAKALSAYYRALERLISSTHEMGPGRVNGVGGCMVTMHEPEKQGAPFLVEWVNLVTDAQRVWLIESPDRARIRFDALPLVIKHQRPTATAEVSG